MSIGPMRSFIKPKLKKSNTPLMLGNKNKISSEGKVPKWKRFLNRDTRTSDTQLTFQDILGKKEKRNVSNLLSDFQFGEKSSSARMIQKRIQTSKDKFYHTGDNFSLKNFNPPQTSNGFHTNTSSKHLSDFRIPKNNFNSITSKPKLKYVMVQEGRLLRSRGSAPSIYSRNNIKMNNGNC